MPERLPAQGNYPPRIAYGPDHGDHFASDHAFGLAVAFGLDHLSTPFAVVTFGFTPSASSLLAQKYDRGEGLAHVSQQRGRFDLSRALGGPQMRSLPRQMEQIMRWDAGSVRSVHEIIIREAT